MRKAGTPRRIFAIVVGYKSRQLLEPCLNALANQTRRPDGIIFVNNAAEDGCSEWVNAHFPTVHVLNAPGNIGYAGGNNFGIHHALGMNADVVFLLNPDVVLTQTCLEILENAMGNDIGFAQPVLEYPDGKVQSAGNLIHYLGFGCSGHSMSTARPGNRLKVSYCSGAALWLDAQALAKTGLFEEALFMYHEDLELGLRAQLANIPSWCVMEARAIHHHSRAGRFGKKFAIMEGNRWFVWIAYHGMFGITILFPFFLLAEVAIFLQSIRQRWFFDKIQAMLQLPGRISDIRKLRKKLLRFHPSPGNAILPLLCDHLDFPQPESTTEACANAVSRRLFPFAKRLLQVFSGVSAHR